eukprot:365730-Chlamydomonas_euryale.AAC.6
MREVWVHSVFYERHIASASRILNVAAGFPCLPCMRTMSSMRAHHAACAMWHAEYNMELAAYSVWQHTACGSIQRVAASRMQNAGLEACDIMQSARHPTPCMLARHATPCRVQGMRHHAARVACDTMRRGWHAAPCGAGGMRHHAARVPCDTMRRGWHATPCGAVGMRHHAARVPCDTMRRRCHATPCGTGGMRHHAARVACDTMRRGWHNAVRETECAPCSAQHAMQNVHCVLRNVDMSHGGFGRRE